MRVRVPPSAPNTNKPLILLKAVEVQWPGFALATKTRYKTRMSEMEKYPHLYRSGPRGVLNFRRAVPPDLRSIIGNLRFVASLKSAGLKAALPAYHEIAQRTEARFKAAKEQLTAGTATGAIIKPEFELKVIDLTALTKRHLDTVIASSANAAWTSPSGRWRTRPQSSAATSSSSPRTSELAFIALSSLVGDRIAPCISSASRDGRGRRRSNHARSAGSRPGRSSGRWSRPWAGSPARR